MQWGRNADGARCTVLCGAGVKVCMPVFSLDARGGGVGGIGHVRMVPSTRRKGSWTRVRAWPELRHQVHSERHAVHGSSSSRRRRMAWGVGWVLGALRDGTRVWGGSAGSGAHWKQWLCPQHRVGMRPVAAKTNVYVNRCEQTSTHPSAIGGADSKNSSLI